MAQLNVMEKSATEEHTAFLTYHVFQKREQEEGNWDSVDSSTHLNCEVENKVENSTWADAE